MTLEVHKHNTRENEIIMEEKEQDKELANVIVRIQFQEFTSQFHRESLNNFTVFQQFICSFTNELIIIIKLLYILRFDYRNSMTEDRKQDTIFIR